MKDAANLAKHGRSLADAIEFDFAGAAIRIDDRIDHGEIRFRAFARQGSEGRCLVFTVVDTTTIRAISYRRAREKELRRYGL